MNSNFIMVITGIGLLLLILAAISSVADSDVPRSEKTRWILVVGLLPLLGLAVWWRRGPKRT